MYQVMRQTRKPCFAFKILAAGRIGHSGEHHAFRQAFASIKPIDGIDGMFPRTKDEVREANRGTVSVGSWEVLRPLSGAPARTIRQQPGGVGAPAQNHDRDRSCASRARANPIARRMGHRDRPVFCLRADTERS